jgi:hypothetical protein
LLLAIGFAVLAIGRTGFADEPVPSDRRLPKNVVAYMSLHDVGDFKARWAKTLFGQMLEDDAFADFRSDAIKHFNEFSEKAEAELGIGLTDLLSIPHGEIAAAGVVLPGGKLSGVVFLDFGDRQDTVQKLIDKAVESLDENKKRAEEEVDDTKIISYATEEGEGGTKPQAAIAYFIKDSFLVVGTHVAALKEVLTRWDGKHERTLADNETYRYMLDKCRDESSDAHPQVVWFVDAVALVQSAIASQPNLPPQVMMGMGAIPLIGLDKFKGLGGTLDMARGEYDTVSRMLIVLDRSNQGIGNVFQFDSTAMAPPKWLSSEWTGYSAINWNAGKAYSAVETLADMFVGPGTVANAIQNLADSPEYAGIHLKKDVIDQLTGMIHIAQDDGASGGKSAAEGYLFGIQIKNAATARATLAKIAAIPGLGKVTEREFQGETLYEMEIASDDDDDDDAGSRKRAFAVTEGHVMIATDVRLLERVLRGVGDRETLADSAEYKRIARKFPARTNSIGFSRQDTQFKSALEVLKSLPLAGLTGDAEAFELDFSKLPDFDLLKKYLPPTGSFMEQDARGLKITSFSLRNEGE